MACCVGACSPAPGDSLSISEVICRAAWASTNLLSVPDALATKSDDHHVPRATVPTTKASTVRRRPKCSRADLMASITGARRLGECDVSHRYHFCVAPYLVRDAVTEVPSKR